MTQTVKSYGCLLSLLFVIPLWDGWLCRSSSCYTDAFDVTYATTLVSRNVGLFATNDAASSPPIEIPIYNGPSLVSFATDDDENCDGDAVPVMEGIIELSELGIDIAIGPSMIVPGQLGLYCRCIDSVDAVTLPECTLLCGYAKPGTFLDTDVGDRTVGFTLQSGTTAIFFERQLMTVQDALAKAATEYGNGACGLAGHDLSQSDEDESIILQPVADGFKRFFYPDEQKLNPFQSKIMASTAMT